MNSSLQEIIACIGHPVAGNPTQFVMERAFAAAHVDSRCLTVDVEPSGLEMAIRGMESMGFSGAVVASPHQVACRHFLNRESPECSRLAEVDLIHRETDGFVGANSLHRAINELLAEQHPMMDKRAVILGAGRSARAAALVLSQSGLSHLTIVSPSDGQLADRISGLVRDHTNCPLDLQVWTELYRVPGGTDIVVQTSDSPTSDEGTPLTIDWSGLTSSMILMDTTYEYGSPRTEFVRHGNQAGATCISGIDLFVRRAAVAFQLWTEHEPDTSVVREAIEEFMLV